MRFAMDDDVPHPAWPADMLITEERRDGHLLPLLYAHCAWGIDVVPEFTHPTAQPAPARRPVRIADEQLRDTWVTVYRETLEARITKPIPVAMDDDNVLPALQAWKAAAPPALDDRYRSDWDDEAYLGWLDQVAPVEDPVEYPDAVVPALVTAWRAGLRAVTVLPVTEPFVRWSCPAELIVSVATRSDVRRFSEALASRREGPREDREGLR